jgi:hypothetical protein
MAAEHPESGPTEPISSPPFGDARGADAVDFDDRSADPLGVGEHSVDERSVDQPGVDQPGVDQGGVVVPINTAAAVYEALADGIRGAAAGWSPTALELLEAGLRQRYGHLLGGDRPIRRLVELAQRSDAA